MIIIIVTESSDNIKNISVFNSVGPVHEIGFHKKGNQKPMTKKLVPNVGPMVARHLMHPESLLTTW